MPTSSDHRSGHPSFRIWISVLLFYVGLSAWYTWPLLGQARTLIASDPGDPILTASILWWDATTWPFSSAWWNAPHYYPSLGVAAFTENLVGLMPLSAPVFWMTHNPILAHNIAYFLAWPLTAFSGYLLVRLLTRRDDAAIVAGLAFGFSPYRITELSHIHMISVYSIAIVLYACHAYLADGRRRWLWIGGASWILVALSNLYFMLFGGVLVALWLAFFCSPRRMWGRGAALGAAFSAASLTLVPVLYKYRVIHDYFGLRRGEQEAQYFSARAQSWVEVSDLVWLWGRVFSPGKDNLFPGITAVMLVLIAIAFGIVPRDRVEATPRWHRVVRPVLAAVVALSVAAILVAFVVGPLTFTVAGILVRMTTIDRALTLTIVAGVSWTLLTPAWRAALSHRRPFAFYTAATLAMAIFACGPSIRAGEQTLLDSAPYSWLVLLPGFDGVRVPSRFWMPGVMCLSVSAGLALDAIRPARQGLAIALTVVVAAGILVDGWIKVMPMVEPFEHWPGVENSSRSEPILELPLGPYADWGATFRAAGHRRRVVNGVSGYDPPHYDALRVGLERRDRAVLEALASLGALDIVVNGAQDPDGAWLRLAASVPGAVPRGSDGVRTLFHVPGLPAEPALGPVLPVARVYAIGHETGNMHDGRVDTGWGDIPQVPGQWIELDLGLVQPVGGVTQSLGRFHLDYPRRLSIEISVSGNDWEPVWEGAGAAPAFLALARGPREGAMRFAFAPRQARYVRLLQLEHSSTMWRVSEVTVHGPP